MEPTMRVSVRNGQEIPAEGMLIDAFGLAVVFSTLAQSPDSRVYVYEGVQFWRANNAFVVSFGGASFMVRNEIGLEAFHSLLLEQKAS
ncbi:MAG: hypothetical protein E6Q96_03265 [Cyclobacteriaceae bacterium]|nr:MAG: hypothetical protein E6Q96_03265 [Cyclobacteriaceae bacterium]